MSFCPTQEEWGRTPARQLAPERESFRGRTIRGHVFCSFLALVLMDELKRRLASQGTKLEWDAVRHDLEALTQVEVRDGEQRYLLCSPLQGTAGKVLQAAGVAPPPPVRPA